MRPNLLENRKIAAFLTVLVALLLFAEHRWARNRINELETTSKTRADELELICSQLALLQELSRNGINKRSAELERLVGRVQARVGRPSRQETPELRTTFAVLDGLIKTWKVRPLPESTPDSHAHLYKTNFLEFKNAVVQHGASEANRLLGDGNITWHGYVRSYDSAEVPPRFTFGPTQVVGEDDLIVSVTLSASLLEGEKEDRNKTVQISQLVEVRGVCTFLDDHFNIPSATGFKVITQN